MELQRKREWEVKELSGVGALERAHGRVDVVIVADALACTVSWSRMSRLDLYFQFLRLRAVRFRYDFDVLERVCHDNNEEGARCSARHGGRGRAEQAMILPLERCWGCTSIVKSYFVLYYVSSYAQKDAPWWC